MLIKFLTWCYRNLLELVAWLFLLMGVPLGILYKALSLKIIDLLQDWLPNFLVSYISLVTLFQKYCIINSDLLTIDQTKLTVSLCNS